MALDIESDCRCAGWMYLVSETADALLIARKYDVAAEVEGAECGSRIQ